MAAKQEGCGPQERTHSTILTLLADSTSGRHQSLLWETSRQAWGKGAQCKWWKEGCPKEDNCVYNVTLVSLSRVLGKEDLGPNAPRLISTLYGHQVASQAPESQFCHYHDIRDPSGPPASLG